MIDVIIVMGICMQNHKCNEVENAFPIFKVNRLVRVHTDNHITMILLYNSLCGWHINT